VSAGGPLSLAVGDLLSFDGASWTVARLEPQVALVHLADGAGSVRRVHIRELIEGAGAYALGAAAGGPNIVRQPAGLGDLSEAQAALVRLRVAHLLEAETGFRSGDARRALPGEPRAAYDPAVTALSERRRAKAAELAALDREQARLLGLGAVGERTLRRWAARYRQGGEAGCIDGRLVRARTGHRGIGEELAEAIFAVRAQTLHRSKVSMRTRERLIRQYVAERYGTAVAVPGYHTLWRVWGEWFGPGGARARYQRSAQQAAQSMAHVVVHRPGQVVALDTTVLPVKVREEVFGDPVSVHLTLGLDLYTHSIVAFRVTLVSDTSVDVAMLLRDIAMPHPMREGWGEAMAWPYPGIPAAVVAEFAGYEVAGLPFFTPETVTTDHGSVYKIHHLVEAQRAMGINILPSRALRPTDKQAAERAFGGIRSLLFEALPGYTGVDVADRGADVEGDAALTVAQMEHLIATWIVAVWQNRVLGEYAPCWGPGQGHSPNSLFAAALAQGGFALQVPRPELYYQVLPAHHVKIHGRRGVKIAGLWYDGPGLNPYRERPSARGGRHAGRWVVRSDRRDRRTVFFQDPADPQV
jgi:hypothetical protein